MIKWSIIIIISFSLLIWLVVPHPLPAQPNRDFYTRINQLRNGLMIYAERHNGLFPEGKSSTEVFQKLINDNEIQSVWVYFPMSGKSVPSSDSIVPDNVCFDFTMGTNARSPSWVPLVLPTGYLINYKSGEAIKLPIFAIREDPIKVAYTQDMLVYPRDPCQFYIFRENHINVMPKKPVDANISQYHQLTPQGSIRENY